MIEYPKHATAEIGAYSVPDWFEPLDRLPAVGQLSKAAIWVAPEQTMLTSSCGFNHLPRRTTMDKMLVLADAKRALGG
jgi:hypothetical protein